MLIVSPSDTSSSPGDGARSAAINWIAREMAQQSAGQHPRRCMRSAKPNSPANGCLIGRGRGPEADRTGSIIGAGLRAGCRAKPAKR
jgi:hypothetical protein